MASSAFVIPDITPGRCLWLLTSLFDQPLISLLRSDWVHQKKKKNQPGNSKHQDLVILTPSQRETPGRIWIRFRGSSFPLFFWFHYFEEVTFFGSHSTFSSEKYMCLARRALSSYPALNTPGIFSMNYSLAVTVCNICSVLEVRNKNWDCSQDSSISRTYLYMLFHLFSL